MSLLTFSYWSRPEQQSLTLMLLSMLLSMSLSMLLSLSLLSLLSSSCCWHRAPSPPATSSLVRTPRTQWPDSCPHQPCSIHTARKVQPARLPHSFQGRTPRTVCSHLRPNRSSPQRSETPCMHLLGPRAQSCPLHTTSTRSACCCRRLSCPRGSGTGCMTPLRCPWGCTALARDTLRMVWLRSDPSQRCPRRTRTTGMARCCLQGHTSPALRTAHTVSQESSLHRCIPADMACTRRSWQEQTNPHCRARTPWPGRCPYPRCPHCSWCRRTGPLARPARDRRARTRSRTSCRGPRCPPGSADRSRTSPVRHNFLRGTSRTAWKGPSRRPWSPADTSTACWCMPGSCPAGQSTRGWCMPRTALRPSRPCRWCQHGKQRRCSCQTGRRARSSPGRTTRTTCPHRCRGRWCPLHTGSWSSGPPARAAHRRLHCS